MAPYRFLLDQNFPAPTFGLDELDETVQFVHLWTFDKRLSEESTPDWMVYLAIAAAGFDGIVTRDYQQINQDDALICLNLTELCVITWAQPIEDAITEWAQLMAYMPEIKKRMDERRRRIILLPAPRLRPEQLRHASDLLGERASTAKSTVGEIRSDAVKRMRTELTKRKRPDLLTLLDGTRT